MAGVLLGWASYRPIQGKPLKMLGSIGRDRTPCHRAAGEADHRHIGGGNQKIPGLAIPDEHINDARRKLRKTADDLAHQTARSCVLARQIMTALVPAPRAGACEQITSPQCQAISLCPRSLKLSVKNRSFLDYRDDQEGKRLVSFWNRCSITCPGRDLSLEGRRHPRRVAHQDQRLASGYSDHCPLKVLPWRWYR
jgi:hypothetical protein